VYEVWPESLTVSVYCTVDPGVVVDTLDDKAMVRLGTWIATVVLQAGSVPPAGQLLAGVGEVTAVVRTLLPVSGSFTVTEKVIVAVAPAARSPVQVRFGLE
jgi:hypothetical protein